MTEKDNINQFILELEVLSRKYNLVIGGSPYIDDLTKGQLHDEAGYSYIPELRWVSKDDTYDWESRATKIIKPT